MTKTLRFATLDDAAAIQAIYAPFCEQSAVSFEFVAPTVEEIRDRIAKILMRFPWLVCESAGEVVGYVYASPNRERAAYQWGVDVAVYIDPRQHRSGVGRILYSALFDLLRAQGFFHAYAGITLPNPGSVGLHAAMGFELVAVYKDIGFKDGAWRDVGWFHLALQPLDPSPAPPRTWRELDPRVVATALGLESI
jgi:phosphinothricin acetyltransferase